MRRPILAIATALTLSGCAHSTHGGFQRVSSGYAIATETGVVVSKRDVETSSGGTGLGATIGAFAGGIAGSQIGPSRSRRSYRRGSSAASVLGAFGGVIIGGLIGAAIENDLSRQVGTEYVVKLDDGSLVTIVQGDRTLVPGQSVFLQTTRGGFGQLTPSV